MENRGRESGQALVEFAVILPLLILITLGALDVGRAYFAYTSLANAAREGAMCASLRLLCPLGAANAVNTELGGGLSGSVSTSVSGGGGPGSSVTVTVQHDFALATTAVLGTRRVPIRASATMVVQ